MSSRPVDNGPAAYLRAAFDALAAELDGGGQFPAAAVERFGEEAATAHRASGETARYDVRRFVGVLERRCAEVGHFDAADYLYRVRMDLARDDERARFRDYRETSALLRGWVYTAWRVTSRYGTSPLRLTWVTFNVGFWATLLYFGLDVLTVAREGKHAFSYYAMTSYLSYFVVGFQGLVPGTAALLGTTFWAQLMLTLENFIGLTLIVSLITLAARRGWRGVS